MPKSSLITLQIFLSNMQRKGSSLSPLRVQKRDIFEDIKPQFLETQKSTNHLRTLKQVIKTESIEDLKQRHSPERVIVKYFFHSPQMDLSIRTPKKILPKVTAHNSICKCESFHFRS